MNVALSGSQAAHLASKVVSLGEAGRIVGSLLETEPSLAQELSLEALSVEAGTILNGGALGRVYSATQKGLPTEIDASDLERLTRLETVVATTDRRVSDKLSEIEKKEAGAGLERLGSLMSLAGQVVDLAKQVF